MPTPQKPACKRCRSTTRKLLSTRRCATCERETKKERRERARELRQVRTFGITLEEAKLIEEAQDGGCICAPWTGYDGSGARALSTDHDHRTGEVRGRLCKHCNDLLGRVRDDPTYFRLMIEYLANPPARKVLGVRVVPE